MSAGVLVEVVVVVGLHVVRMLYTNVVAYFMHMFE